MSSFHGQTSKSRSKVVKPMLRKLTQSEKNSLDLDRPAAEQQDGLGIYDYGTGSRSAHDVVFNHAGRRGYHNRSTSGTSQFSTATTGSGHRAGSFVHPFQQTPRPYTPPIASSYQNSLRESEHSNSPVVAEDDDHVRHNLRSASNLSNRTPSLNSASPITSQPALRIQTKQSSSKLALATSHTTSNYLTPLSPDLISPADTMTPASAIRTSIDKGFRIRSRSEAGSGTYRVDSIQEARRKFSEKEAVKEEKAAQEEIRKMEKKNQKEARQIERSHRRSSASDQTRSKRSKSDLTMASEKGVFGRDYTSTTPQHPPFTDGFDEIPRTNSHNAKQKTHGTWTKFMMWLRTRFIRMGKKSHRK